MGSTPPASDVGKDMCAKSQRESGVWVVTSHVIWATCNGCVTPAKHVSSKTHYPNTKDKRPRWRQLLPWQRSLRQEWVIAQARKRVRARAERRRRRQKSETWKTMTWTHSKHDRRHDKQQQRRPTQNEDNDPEEGITWHPLMSCDHKFHIGGGVVAQTSLVSVFVIYS